jgi:hypothetical protein
MSKQSENKPKSFWPLVNAVTAPLAFLIIGYVVWAAINAKPRVVQVTPEPALTVIDLNNLEDKPTTETPSAPAEDTSKPKEGSPSEGPDSNEPSQVPESEEKLTSSPTEKSSTPSEEPAPKEEDAENDLDTKTEPAPEPDLPPKPKVVLGPAPKFYNVDVAKFLFEKKCSECHKLKRIENHAFADVTAVERLIDKMVENGLEVNEKERSFLEYYVQSTYLD